MLKNYLVVAVRNLRNHKLFSFINIFGFTIGLTCSILVFLFVHDELTYDRHGSNWNRIYRVVSESRDGDYAVETAQT